MENKQHDLRCPISVRRAAATAEAVSAINAICSKHHLPYYILEDILYRLYSEARDGAYKEMRIAEKEYNEAVAKHENAKNAEFGGGNANECDNQENA